MTKKTRRAKRESAPRRASGGRLSACLIVRDEAACVGECLASLRGLADEIIVVDTGSTDDTPAIAAAAGARVEHLPWPDSFAAARNASLAYATGAWVLVLDADEALAPCDHDALRALLEAPADVMGYVLVQRNYTNDQSAAHWRPAEPGCVEARGAAGWFPAPIVRLFRNDPRIRFEGEVHEGVDAAIQAAGGRVLPTTIPIHHYGKLRGPARTAAKAALYRSLGETKAARTDSAAAHYELGLQYAELELLDQAEAELCAATEADPTSAKAWADLGAVRERRGAQPDAESAYRRALTVDADYLPARVNLGSLLAAVGRRSEAEAMFAEALRLNPDNPVILNNLAAHLAGLGRLADAERLYRRAIAISPTYPQAHVNLGNLLDRAQRFDDARTVLENACAMFPDHAPAHAALALVHTRFGAWREAEAAGARAVALFDGDAIAWANLGVARFELGLVEPAMAATYRATRLDPSYEPAARNWEHLATRYPSIAVRIEAAVAAPAVAVQTGPRIVFCHQGQPFTGSTLRERGLGGTESATVLLAEALAARGGRITVFNHCASAVDVHDVAYRPLDGYAAAVRESAPDIVIAVRAWQALERTPDTAVRVFWAHDAADQPAVGGLADPAVRARIDRYVGVSAWQIGTYCERFGIPESAWTLIRNGVHAPWYATPRPDRDRFRLIYASTPYRGLDVLLEVFGRIRAAEPRATLDLYTGMSLYGIDAADDRARHGHLYARAEQPGVTLHGAIPQPDLARALLGAGVLAYPNHFAETSCIAALEAQAAGCPVITSALGALPETVSDGVTGVCVPGDARSPAYQDAFVDAVVGLLRDEARWQAWSERARTRILGEFTWDHIAGEWLEALAAVAV